MIVGKTWAKSLVGLQSLKYSDHLRHLPRCVRLPTKRLVGVMVNQGCIFLALISTRQSYFSHTRHSIVK